MNWQDGALGLAGVIGCTVAVVHGVLVQRLMIRPIGVLANRKLPVSTQRLVPPLLHFSTYEWFVGGVALICAAGWLQPGVRLAVCVLVGSGYLFGAVLNLWATKGRHPGWMLMAAAVALIVVGARP